jgi:creatinine amidohydrolase
MRWDLANASDLKRARERGCTVAILPVGSTEYHAPHLACGIDSIIPQAIATRAAEIEEAVVLPAVSYAYEDGSKARMGTIGIPPEVLIPYLEAICDEVARNGFTKIVVVNGHGGNVCILKTFTHTLLNHRKEYLVYLVYDPFSLYGATVEDVREAEHIGHACEIETSVALAIDEALVKRADMKAATEHNRDTRGILPVETYGEIDWHIMMPQGYTGDSHTASAAKGKKLMEAAVASLVELLRKIKADTVTESFLRDNYARAREPWKRD